MRVRRPMLQSALRAKANIKPTQTCERTKQGQAAACTSESELEMDRYWIGTGPRAYQSWQLNPKETLRSTVVESGLVFCYFCMLLISLQKFSGTSDKPSHFLQRTLLFWQELSQPDGRFLL